jgi:putative DNA primase/helicase
MLMVAEGIETTLAAMQATGLSAWAALSTSGLAALRLPPEVRQVIIVADNDANAAGERAARTAEQRWLAEGRKVWIWFPPRVGADANDLLREARNAA